jgi:predicted small secreted protein
VNGYAGLWSLAAIRKRCFMKNLAKVMIWFALILSCLSSLSCHTVHGVGEDVENAGQEIEKVSK